MYPGYFIPGPTSDTIITAQETSPYLEKDTGILMILT
jgi:hypothetical protein